MGTRNAKYSKLKATDRLIREIGKVKEEYGLEPSELRELLDVAMEEIAPPPEVVK